jgi:myo-inositol-1-phosphate synthase
VVFTGWDIFEDNVYESAAHAEVLDKETLAKLKPYLETIKPMPAVFDQFYVKRLHGTHVKKGKNKRDLAEQLRADIQAFKKTVDRVVMIWCGSTEIFLEPTAVHQSIAAFEKGLEDNDVAIAPSQIYAYAALSEGVPFANGAPNLTVDTPAMIELSKKNAAPICGKDFKTGQTFMKTVLAPAFKARKSQSWDRSITSFSRSFIPISTKRSTTRFALSITRLAATRKKPGTTSISSAGWATRCRSR